MTANTVYRGTQITRSHLETMKETDLYDIYTEIREDEGLRDEIARIRKVAVVDKQAYARVKTRLPYFCFASFQDLIRKSDRFLRIQAFVIDIDHIPDDELMVKIREEISRDPRVKMLFTSPGGKGIKAVYELSEPCTSLRQYADFYKIFSYRFCEAYSLEGMLDFSTCDATRVTFLSSDPEAMFNSRNEPVNMHEYLPALLPSGEGQEETPTVKQEVVSGQATLDETVYQDILRTLNPTARIPKKEKQIYVPEVLNLLEKAIRSEIEKVGLVTREIRDIHYGKKVVAAHGLSYGEVNLFFGKRGFSVVKSPKTGSDSRLAGILEMVLWKVLAEFSYPEVQPRERIHYLQN